MKSKRCPKPTKLNKKWLKTHFSGTNSRVSRAFLTPRIRSLSRATHNLRTSADLDHTRDYYKLLTLCFIDTFDHGCASLNWMIVSIHFYRRTLSFCRPIFNPKLEVGQTKKNRCRPTPSISGQKPSFLSANFQPS